MVFLICAIFYYRRSSGPLSGPYTSRASHGVNSPCRPFAFLSLSPLPVYFPLAPNQAPPQPSPEARPPQEPHAPASAGGPAAATASSGSAASRCAPRRRHGGEDSCGSTKDELKVDLSGRILASGTGLPLKWSGEFDQQLYAIS